MKKIVLSFLFIIMLCLVMMPTAVFAEGEPHNCNSVIFDQEIKTLDDLRYLFANGGNGYLANNISAAGISDNSLRTIPTGKTVNLCLNGNVYTLGTKNIDIQLGATLNIYDCGTTVHKFKDSETYNGLWVLDDTLEGDSIKHTLAGGCITGGNNNTGGAIYLSWTNTAGAIGATLNIYGGNIVGNVSTSATQGGGAIFVDRPSTFNMYGGKLVGNVANNGGAVYVFSENNIKGTFNMYNGEITENSVTASTQSATGGGVYINGGTMTMYNGKIKGNKAISTAGGDKQGSGGGIYIYTNGTVNTLGGEISQNTVSHYGGGIYAAKGPLTVGGKVKIRDNHSTFESFINNGDTENNVASGVGTVGSDAWVCLHFASAPNAPTKGMDIGFYRGNTTTPIAVEVDDYSSYFSSDNTGFGVKYDSAKRELKLEKLYTITNGTPEASKNSNQGYITINKVKALSGETVEVTANPNVGYTLNEVPYYTIEGEKTLGTLNDSGKYIFTMPDTNITIKATFEIAPKYKVTFETNGGSSIATQEVLKGEKATRPTNPTKEGYTFKDWYTNNNFATTFNFSSPITSDTKVYAKFEKIIPQTQQTIESQNVSATNTPKTGDNVYVYIALMLISVVGLIGTTIIFKNKI